MTWVVGLKLIRGRGQLLVAGWGLGASRAGVSHGPAALHSLPLPAHPGVVLKPGLVFP